MQQKMPAEAREKFRSFMSWLLAGAVHVRMGAWVVWSYIDLIQRRQT